MRETVRLVRDGATGLYRGCRTLARTCDLRGRAAGIAGGILSSDDEYYQRDENVDDYMQSRREHVENHREDFEELAENGELSGKQYITAKELRAVDRYFERQGIDMDQEAPLDGRTVLDATGGEGWLARYLAGNGADVLLGDVSRPMLEEAVKKDPDAPLPDYEDSVVNPVDGATGTIEYIQADVTKLPLPDNSVDDGFIWRSIHHTDDIPGSVAEMKRVVKPGGRLKWDTFHRRSGRILYNAAMGMESSMYTREDVIDRVKEIDGVSLQHLEPRMVMPYGGFRGLPAGDQHLIETVRWNERMEEEWPEYASVDFWEAEVTEG